MSNLKAIREALGLTQEQLAREIKCSINTVRRCEYDGRLPKAEAVLANLARLTRRAGVSLEARAEEVAP
jgi:transcriptional regulator with XRE-family HTH domain